MAEEPTFQGVIERLKAEGLLDRNSGANSIKSLKEINLKGFTLLSYQMEELIDFFKGNALQDEENRRELLQALKGGKKEEKKEGKKKDGGFEMDNLGDLAGTFLAAITGLLAGFVVGLTQNFLLVLKLLGKGLNNLFLKPILNFIKRTKVFRLFRANLFIFTKRIKGLTTGISSFVKNSKVFRLFRANLFVFTKRIKGFTRGISSFVKNGKVFRLFRANLFIFTKRIKGLITGISSFVKNSKVFTNTFKSLKTGIPKSIKAFKDALKIIRSIPKAFGGVSKLIPGGGGGKIMKFLKPLKGFFSTFGKVLPTFFKVGKIFGRLLLPITIITSLFDFVKGAMAGFDKYKDKGFLEGLIGGLLGGISGLAQGLIGMPLDLLKSAISWVAEKLGFENFSEMLDSFSFSELIGGLFTKVTDVIVGFIGSIKEKIAGIGVGGLLKNVALNLLKIFKKVYSFPMAVASGAAAALAAALPGGETPMEAFKAGFARVFNAGDDKIDSFKAVSAGGGSGDEVSEEGLAIKDGVEPEKGFFGRLFGSKDEVESVPEEIAAGSSNSVGAQMEFGMSNIADAKSQGTPVIVSGGSSPQSTVVNNTSATYNGSGHVDESNYLILPQYVPMGGY